MNLLFGIFDSSAFWWRKVKSVTMADEKIPKAYEVTKFYDDI
jgi:hypothetical protein